MSAVYSSVYVFLFHRNSESYIYLLYLYVHYLNHDLYLRNNL